MGHIDNTGTCDTLKCNQEGELAEIYRSTTFFTSMSGIAREIEFREYQTLTQMRQAATLYQIYEAGDGTKGLDMSVADFTDTEAVTFMGHIETNDITPDHLTCPHALIFLAEGHTQPEICAHEATHVAQLFHNIDITHGRKTRIRLSNEELPYLVGDIMHGMDEAGIINDQWKNNNEQPTTIQE
ncbi:hypothetical protein [Bifidobacterium oedipodis]|uniref:Uncharacterized protein n=1 Tax=Bifidobacterium oedipodis TaxID=2675322 RepID=A0A7Y0EP59_9BIFI|nr:hypothetical protein [Bifidobacterium sp. DSM 109957]NMM93908.1 hypothetical protein [Bifidobacterium sp. DSM 109957]